jgi:hypothetical protein
MMRALSLLFRAGGDVGGGASRLRNWRETAILIPRNSGPADF